MKVSLGGTVTARWITLFFFTLSVCSPASSQPANRKMNANASPSKVASKGKKNSAAVKRSESLSLQNQVSPNANGTVTTTVPGAPGAAVPAPGTSVTYAPAGTASTPGVAVPTTGLPGAASRAAGDTSPLLLGYTPAAPPTTPTPIMNQNTGMAMAAMLAAVLGAMFGGQNNQKKQDQAAANTGISNNNGNTPSNTQDVSNSTRAPTTYSDNGAGNTQSDEPATKPESPADPSKVQCDDSTRTGANFEMPVKVDDMQMSMCPDPNIVGGEEPLKFHMDQDDMYGTIVGTETPQKVYPPMSGTIKFFSCNDHCCMLEIQHKNCPGGAKAYGSCVSVFHSLAIDQATREKIEKRKADKRDWLQCESIGVTEDWGKRIGKKDPHAKNYFKFAMYPDSMNKCTLNPFRGFTDAEKFKTDSKGIEAFKGGKLTATCQQTLQKTPIDPEFCNPLKSSKDALNFLPLGIPKEPKDPKNKNGTQ